MHFSKMLFAWRKHEHSQNPNLIHIALRIRIQFSAEQHLRSLFESNKKLEHIYIKAWTLNTHMGIEIFIKPTKQYYCLCVYKMIYLVWTYGIYL